LEKNAEKEDKERLKRIAEEAPVTKRPVKKGKK
jgi:hypothetical protein